MSILHHVRNRVRRAWQIASAFLRIDYIDTMNYPLALMMRALSAFVPILTFYFVSTLIGEDGPDVGGDYYTFVVIGIVSMGILAATLNSFGNMMLRYTQEGQLEMFLVEPVRWRALPFVMIPWQAFIAVMTALLLLILTIFLGAEYRLAGVPTAIVIVVLGLASTLAIGIFGASIKVLSKRADPVLSLYSIAASVLSGAFYPVELLPDWLQAFSWVIPHTYVIQALRKVLMPLGHTLPGPTAEQAILALFLFSLVAYPVALWTFGRLLEYGRKVGALSGY